MKNRIPTIVQNLLLERQVPEYSLISAQPVDPAEHIMSRVPVEHTGTTTTTGIPPGSAITGAILAGGRSQRMGGEDKGLVRIDDRPMVDHIIGALAPQVGSLLINANRNLDDYRRFGYPVVTDIRSGFQGPLMGLASTLQATATRYLLCVPCDSPRPPANLAETLYGALHAHRAEISVAHDGIRMQPVFALVRRNLLADLLSYLEAGGRKLGAWQARHRLAVADFSDCADAFCNVNTRQQHRMMERKLMRAP